MILKEFRFNGISFDSCVLDGTKPFKLIVERYNPVEEPEVDVSPSTVENNESSCDLNKQPAILNDCELPILSDDLSSELISKPALLHDYGLVNFDGELSSDLLDVVPFNHHDTEIISNCVNVLPPLESAQSGISDTNDVAFVPKSVNLIPAIPLVPHVSTSDDLPFSSPIVDDCRTINQNLSHESIDTCSLTDGFEPIKCTPSRQGQFKKPKKVSFSSSISDPSPLKSPPKPIDHLKPLIQPQLEPEAQLTPQAEPQAVPRSESQPQNHSEPVFDKQLIQNQSESSLQSVIHEQSQPQAQSNSQEQHSYQSRTLLQPEISSSLKAPKLHIQAQSSTNIYTVAQSKASDKRIVILDPLFDQPTCSKYLDTPETAESSISKPRVTNSVAVPSNKPSSVQKKKNVVCRKSTAPSSSFKIRKLNDANDEDGDDTELDIFADADGSSTEDDSSDDIQPKRPEPKNENEKSVKRKTKKSPYPSAFEVQAAILNDLHLQLTPRIHLVRIPSFIDLNDPASELEQICATFSKNLFKESYDRVDYIYRHVPKSKKKDDSTDSSDDDPLPILSSQFNKPEQRKRLKITDDSDDEQHEEPEQVPVSKPKRARMSSGAKPRRRILPIESDSSEDETDEMDDDIGLNEDYEEEEEDIVLNETEQKEYSALPEEERYGFLKKRRRRFARRNRQRASDLITLSSDEEEAVEVVEEPIAIPEASTSKDDLNISSQSSTRKNIKRVLTEAELEKATKEATSRERKRIERLTEQEKQYNKLLPALEKEKEEPSLILDINIKAKKSRVEVSSKLVKELKPHQRDGVKFLYDSTIENVNKLNEEGSGCILAHCMGLGKSLQVIAFVHTLLSNPLIKAHIRTILIVVPTNTLKNWAEEFDRWITKNGLKCFKIYEMVNENRANKRAELLQDWRRSGGVLIIGIRNLVILLDRSKSKLPLKLFKVFEDSLCDPGPDMVIIDEGHLLKDQSTQICKTVSSLKTKRKIILTGTPLQNNLIEYYTMINIIAPRLLGSIKEYTNRFVNPIENGQKADSTIRDVELMKQSLAILNKLLSGCIQRCGYETLKPFLEKRLEYTLFIRPTKRVAKMYNHYLDLGARKDQLFADVSPLRLCVNHPALFQIQDENALITGKPKKLKFPVQSGEFSSPEKINLSTSNNQNEEPAIESDWYKQFSELGDSTNIELSSKFVMLFKILRACIAVGDKLLVVSQSLETLDLIERCLQLNKQFEVDGESLTINWNRGIHYYRIDGQNSAHDRLYQIRQFNRDNNTDARLFLLSTKAGGIGINLIGANRCIIFDVSWNPSDDIQAIFRVYRFGQPKYVYVYRFVTKDTMEEKIHRNQIQKLGMAIRVVDKHQVKRAFKAAELAEFYLTRPQEEYEYPLLVPPKDRLLADLLFNNNKEVLEYIVFDSLLEKKPEEELTEEERQAAWVDYQKERDAEILAAEERKQALEVERIKHEELKLQAKRAEEARIAAENEKKRMSEQVSETMNRIISGNSTESSTVRVPTTTPAVPSTPTLPLATFTASPSTTSTAQISDQEESTSATPCPLSVQSICSRSSSSTSQSSSSSSGQDTRTSNNNNNNNSTHGDVPDINANANCEKVNELPKVYDISSSELSSRSSVDSSSSSCKIIASTTPSLAYLRNEVLTPQIVHNLNKNRTAFAFKAYGRPRPVIPNLSNFRRPRKNRQSELNNNDKPPSAKKVAQDQQRIQAEVEATNNAINHAFQNRRVYAFETSQSSQSQPKSTTKTSTVPSTNTPRPSTSSITNARALTPSRENTSRTVHQPNLRQHTTDHGQVGSPRAYNYLTQRSSNQQYPNPDTNNRTIPSPQSHSSSPSHQLQQQQQHYPPPQAHQSLPTSSTSAFTGVSSNIASSRGYSQPNLVSSFNHQQVHQPYYSGYSQASLPLPRPQSAPYHRTSSPYLASRPFTNTPPNFLHSRPPYHSNSSSIVQPPRPLSQIPVPTPQDSVTSLVNGNVQTSNSRSSNSVANIPSCPSASTSSSTNPLPPTMNQTESSVTNDELCMNSIEDIQRNYPDLDLASCSLGDMIVVFLNSGISKSAEDIIVQIEKIRTTVMVEVSRMEIQACSPSFSEFERHKKSELEAILKNLQNQIDSVTECPNDSTSQSIFI